MIYLAFGALFGFILSRVGATDYDAILGMFLLEDLHLMGVIGVAVVVAGIGLRVLRPPGIAPKPRRSGNVLGGLVFGAGWAVTGTCPGTALSQLGEGRFVALFTLTGIFLGAALYVRLAPLWQGPATGGASDAMRLLGDGDGARRLDGSV